MPYPPSSSLLSSPASSPACGPIDSSPPSSPPFQSSDYDRDDSLDPSEPSSSSHPSSQEQQPRRKQARRRGSSLPRVSSPPGLAHPFAANSKAVKKFRMYEKPEDEAARKHAFISPTRARRRRRDSSWGRQITDEDDPMHLDDNDNDDDGYGDGDGDTTLGCDASMTICALSETEPESNADSDEGGEDMFEDEHMEHDNTLEEHEIWEKKISEAIDQGNGLIDLSSTSFGGVLTTIPPSIADLENLVVLPGLTNQPSPPLRSRFSPEPASSSSPKPTRRFLRAFTDPVLGAAGGAEGVTSPERVGLGKSLSNPHATPASKASSATLDEVQLYVANHSIQALPMELFWITNLTALSLRGNFLTSLPPQIATSFPHLRELNVSLNQLTYLPAEILNLRLESFMVANNPWIRPPNDLLLSSPTAAVNKKRRGGTGTDGSDTGIDAAISDGKRDSPAMPKIPISDTKKPLYVGDKMYHFIIPSLTELCYRVLMSPASSSHPRPSTTLSSTSTLLSGPAPRPICSATRSHIPATKRDLTILESKYDLPLVRTEYPGPVVDTIYACVPRSIADVKSATREDGVWGGGKAKAGMKVGVGAVQGTGGGKGKERERRESGEDMLGSPKKKARLEIDDDGDGYNQSSSPTKPWARTGSSYTPRSNAENQHKLPSLFAHFAASSPSFSPSRFFGNNNDQRKKNQHSRRRVASMVNPPSSSPSPSPSKFLSPSRSPATKLGRFHSYSGPDSGLGSELRSNSSGSPRTRRTHARTRSLGSKLMKNNGLEKTTTMPMMDPPKPTHPGISVCPSPKHYPSPSPSPSPALLSSPRPPRLYGTLLPSFPSSSSYPRPPTNTQLRGGGGGEEYRKPVYVRHAVERFTWEDEIAGVKMGEAGGVPVLWRGCGAGCLDWLDHEGDEDEEGDDGDDKGGEEDGKMRNDGVRGDGMVGEGGEGEGEGSDRVWETVDLGRGLPDEFDEEE